MRRGCPAGNITRFLPAFVPEIVSIVPVVGLIRVLSELLDELPFFCPMCKV